MKRLKIWLAALVALCLLAPAALGEALSVDAAAAPEEITINLGEGGAAAKDGEDIIPQTIPLTLDIGRKKTAQSMSSVDTLRIRATGGALTGCTASKKGIVSIGSLQTDEAGAYIDVKAEAPVKKLNLSVTVTPATGRARKLTVALTVTDPFAIRSLSFKDAPATLPVGNSVVMTSFLEINPTYASLRDSKGKSALVWKASGAAKIDKDTSVLTARKAGKATVTVTSAADKKIKATHTIQVLANSVKDINRKPGSGDFAEIAGSWTLWPKSIAPGKKGVDCEFFVLNGTADKATQIENLKVQVAAGSAGSVIAEATCATVKAAVAKNSSKVVKLTLAATPAFGDVFLPEASLAFVVNDDALLRTKAGTVPYKSTKTQPDTPTGPTDDFYAENGQLRGYDGAGGDIVVPAVGTDGLPIVEVSPGALKNHTEITGITLPATVTKIGYDAFEGCTNLKRIQLSASLETIGSFAFNGCSSLDNLVLPSTLTTIENSAFQNCSNLSGITLPTGLTAVGDHAFSGCDSITGLHIPATLTECNAEAFHGLGGLLAFTVDAGNSRFSTANGALTNEEGTEILAGPCGVTGEYDVPLQIKVIGHSAFAGAKLSGIVLHDGIYTLGNAAFMGCQNLTEITIPWQVGKLSDALFANCVSLTTVTFMTKVYIWGSDVFADCTVLKTFRGYSDATQLIDYVNNHPGMSYEPLSET